MSYQIISGNQIVATGATRGKCVAALARVSIPTHVRVDIDGNVQHIYVCRPIWAEREIKLSRMYTYEWTYDEILNDIALDVCAMHGYKLQQVKEVY